ncbi:MAG: NAD(P)-binding protein [Lachnospiraceae bacterium]|nr:NAD(P)-binding protein [Lachnospiraceae bacterium]
MIQIQDLRLSYRHRPDDIKKTAAGILKVVEKEIREIRILRRSIDARKKPAVEYVYTVAVSVPHERTVLRSCRSRHVSHYEEAAYVHPEPAGTPLAHRPVVVGAGPAGLFCAYYLALAGYQPLLIERGDPVEERMRRVEAFWSGTAQLDPQSNVQFGEGGAGTFSDGKLNTMVKDPLHRGRLVMETFVRFGAPEEILWLQKPHIGTDRLRDIIKKMRRAIEEAGGEVRFRTQLTDLIIENGRLSGILTGEETIPCEVCVLALGHSARDTFRMLLDRQIAMEPKPFAVGLRIEHPQEMIGQAQYGSAWRDLPAADYKLTWQTGTRGVYSFCMCPGGYVVNASSEPGRTAVNGMSNYARDGENANSAIVVTVSPSDYEGEGPLKGVAFQRSLEEAAFRAGEGLVPVQLFADFCAGTPSAALGEVTPCIRGGYRLANLREILPEDIGDSLEEGIHAFGRKIHGFDRGDAVLSGIESRTSSPVRILRDEHLQSIPGLYPSGEGAGYAGGITSAAMDGVRIYEAIVAAFGPPARP